MFKYETKGYRFLVWSSVAAMGLRAAALIAAIVALALFFLPSEVSSSAASRIAIAAVAVDFISLAYLFFSSFSTKLFRKRTVWSFVGAAAILFCALVLCVIMVAFEPGSFAAVFSEILAYALIGVYMIVPGWFSCTDVTELFKKLKEEARIREASVSERVRNARK